jgi:arginase family enzyme
MRRSHIAIIGAPLDLGQDRRGVDMGPSALRVANLNRRLAALGYEVDDLGNVPVEQAESLPSGPVHAKYLPQIAASCKRIGRMVEDALARGGGAGYELILFVSGASELSARAIASAKRLCDAHLTPHYRLTVVDVHDDLAAVMDNRVIATPTLVRTPPPPVRRVVGDLSQPERVLRALDLLRPTASTDPLATR